MKKLLLLTVFICIVLAMSAATSRVYMQRLNLTDGSMPGNPGVSNTPIGNYNLAVTVTGDATVYQTTGAGNPANICLRRTGASPNFYVVAYVNQSIFAVNWPIGSTLSFTCTYIPTGETLTWTKVVPTGTSSILDTATPLIAPPYPVADWNFEVTSAPVGAAIWVDGVNSTFVTPHTFAMAPGASALYTVAMTDYTWVPASYQVTNIAADGNVNFVGTYVPPVVTPGIAVLDAPANNAHFPATAAHTAAVLLQWHAGVGPAPTSYRLVLDGAAAVDLGLVVSHPLVLAEGPHTWQIFAFHADAKSNSTKLGTPVAVRATTTYNTRDLAAGSEIWNVIVDPYVAPPVYWDFAVTSLPTAKPIYVDGVISAFVTPHTFSMLEGTSALYTVVDAAYTWAPVDYQVTNIVAIGSVEFVGTLVPTYEVPAGSDTPVNGIVVNSSINLNIDETVTLTNPILLALPTYNPAGSFVMSFDGSGLGDLTINVPAGIWYLGLYDGIWHWSVPFPFVGPAQYTFVGVNYGAKADVIIMGSPVDPTLPVELSSFTAVLTAEYFVNLTWVTESETQVLGFNVYRSETNDVASAVRVNASAIGATNTSEQHTYTMTDREVETNATYYYWLENVDMGGGNAMHGPQMVTVTGNPTPVLPEISMLNSAYPNPFRSGANTNINVSIKAGETGTVTVYNILGQTVKTFKVNEGTHTLRWDGKNCGSGIYFYKLTTPTTNATKKLVIVK